MFEVFLKYLNNTSDIRDNTLVKVEEKIVEYFSITNNTNRNIDFCFDIVDKNFTLEYSGSKIFKC